MSEITFNKTIQSIHKEIQGKLRKTNTIIDNYLMSDISVIPQLGQYFFKQRGKQLRPVLCLLSSKMINKDYSQLKTDIYMSAAEMLIEEGYVEKTDFPFGTDGYKAPTPAEDIIDGIAFDAKAPNAYIDSLTIGLKTNQMIDGSDVKG